MKEDVITAVVIYNCTNDKPRVGSTASKKLVVLRIVRLVGGYYIAERQVTDL